MKLGRAGAFCVALALGACAGGSLTPAPPALRAAPLASAATASNDIPPRLQWMNNYGYCGETSFASAGLYYGQYVSQWKARALASPGVPQSERASQLLVGVNDLRAARAMHLRAIEWPAYRDRSTADFLAWVAQNVAAGYPVIIGVYTNETRFHAHAAGDPQYDHIVPVVAVTNQTLTFSDNGLKGFLPSPSRWRPLKTYLFTYRFDDVARTRAQANAPSAPWYSVPLDGSGQTPGNFGVAIAGPVDGDGSLLPVRVATNVPWEYPYVQRGQTVAPKPQSLVLTVTVSGLRPGRTYYLYRYDRFDAVPDERFNANASRAAQRWTLRIASGSTYVLSQPVLSNDVAVYRAVPATAP